MAMDFSRSAPTAGQSLRSNLFGTTAGAGQDGPAQRQKAEFWLNIGYLVEVPNEQGGVEDRFVSLPMGLPLDTMEKLPTNRGSDSYRQFQSARNEFLADLVEGAKASLQPGQEHIIELGDRSIAIQIRRVAQEKEAVSSENNPFRRKLRLRTPDGE